MQIFVLTWWCQATDMVVPGNVSDGFFRRHGLPRVGNLISLVLRYGRFLLNGEQAAGPLGAPYLTLTALRKRIAFAGPLRAGCFIR